MADALDRDFSKSRAVLIGTSTYTELRCVPAAGRSLDRFEQLLTGPLCGWPEDQVTKLSDHESVKNLPDMLVESFAEVTDVALFYYVGHGQYDFDDKLCLALVDTREDSARRATTSLTFEAVRYAFRASRATTKIAILDCCFAGLAGNREGSLAADSVPLPPSSGFYLMMASGEYSKAWFELEGTRDKPQTYFTKYLIDTVERGLPGEGEGLRLAAVFEAAAGRLVRDGKPEPGSRAGDQAGNFLFARNLAVRERGRDVSTETLVPFRAALRGTSAVVRVSTRCPVCEGLGRADDAECTACHGSGETGQHRTRPVALPPGVADGDRIRVEGQGWAGPGDGPPGDLYVTVHVEPDPVFGRSGADLTATLAISHSERVHGATVSLRVVDTWVPVQVSPGTPYGTVLRLDNRGFPTPDGDRGALMVTVEAAAPADAESDARLVPPAAPAAARPAPDPAGPVTGYRWSVRKVLARWAQRLLFIGLLMVPIALHELIPALRAISTNYIVTPVEMGILGALFPVARRLFTRRRPPLRLTDDGLDDSRFGFLSWADLASVWPSAPGHPWVTVVLRRTELLSNGQPSPLVVPAVMLSDLRGRSHTIAEDMRRHCPSLVVNSRH